MCGNPENVSERQTILINEKDGDPRLPWGVIELLCLSAAPERTDAWNDGAIHRQIGRFLPFSQNADRLTRGIGDVFGSLEG